MVPRFFFGDIVIVDKKYIGVICKTWEKLNRGGTLYYEVYVRSYNSIRDYDEEVIVRLESNKELSRTEIKYYKEVLSCNE